jgi:hypothetical protein
MLKFLFNLFDLLLKALELLREGEEALKTEIRR